MELSLSEIIELAEDRAYEACRDWLPDLVQLLPGVAAIEVAHREQHDDGPRVVDRWRLREPVPRIMRPYFPDPAIFVERARWNDADRSVTWELELEARPGVVTCRGSTQLRPGPRDATTELQLTASLAIDLSKIERMPRVLQGLAAEAERFALEHVRSNLTVLCRSLPRYLEDDAEQATTQPIENP
jgi:hypothetical protein